MSKYIKSPKQNNESPFNLSFICSQCNKKYHINKISKSENGVCVVCHPVDELEDLVTDSNFQEDAHKLVQQSINKYWVLREKGYYKSKMVIENDEIL